MAEYTQAQLESMVSQIQADGLESLRSSDVCALLFGYGDLLAKRDTLAAELVALRPDAALAANLRQIIADRGWPMQWDLPLDQMVEKAFLEERRVACELSVELNTAVNELKALRAGLPRWQRHGELWLLIAGTHRVWVEPVGDKWRPMHFGPETYSLEDAMVVAGGYLGLPPCEVEGE